MFALRSVTRAMPQAKSIMQARNMSAVSGPPKVRVGFTEKMIHGLIMAAGYVAVPAWVLVHIREYRGQS